MEKNKISKFKLKTIEIKNLCPDVKHLVFSTPPDFTFIPGQFITITINVNGKLVRRPYSIASKPKPNSLDLCIKILQGGKATPTIDNIKISDELDAVGPLGGFTIQKKSMNKPIIFISTGTGITPFRSMIPHLLENNFKNKLVLLTGYRYEKNELYRSEFKNLENNYENFLYHRILSQPESESKNDNQEIGRVQKLVEKYLIKDADYYICGLKDMVLSVKDLLLEKGIPNENIFFERYD